MPPFHPQTWRSPEEIVQIGFQRSPVVMVNEAQHGMARCVRTRQIGQRLIPAAHQSGVRALAIEALTAEFAAYCNTNRQLPLVQEGYLSQPDMRALIQTAVDLGWQLIAYEATDAAWALAQRDWPPMPSGDNLEQLDTYFLNVTNWREEQQAGNLIDAIQALPANSSLLVWCGNSHHAKEGSEGWLPMGYHFKQQSGLEAFVIDQTISVNYDHDPMRSLLVEEFAKELESLGGTAGFLREESPPVIGEYHIADAYLLSLENELE